MIRYCLGEGYFASPEVTSRIAAELPFACVLAEIIVSGKPWVVARPLRDASLNESGSVPADSAVYVYPSAKLVNAGSLAFADGSYLGGVCVSGTPIAEFDNTGSITANGTSSNGVTVANAGYPCLDTEDSGSLNVASGLLAISGRNFNFNTGATVTGGSDSQLVLNDTVAFNASSLSLPAPVQAAGGPAGCSRSR